MELQSLVSARYISLNLTWLIVALFSVVFYLATRRNRRIEKCLEKFDGPFSLPIIGTALWFIRPNSDLVPMVVGFYKKYNSVFKMWIGNQAYVAINRAEEAEKILSSTIHTEKSTDYNLFHKWLGLGLLTAKPKKWHSRRKLLTPAFHFKILEEFLAVFNEHGNTFVEVLKSNESKGNAFDIFPYVTRCTLDIICETAMGTKVNAQKGEPMTYVDGIYGYADILIKKILLPWFQIEWIWNLNGYGRMERDYLKVLHGFTENIIAARKLERKEAKSGQEKEITHPDAELDSLPKRRKAFLDLLLDFAENEDSTLTDLEIRNEVDTFMFEGHDTTAASVVWTIFLLALYPENQKKVQEELDDIFGDDKTREITAADISKMKYLELCIKESLRLYPSVPFFIRHLNQDADLGDGRIVPKGTNVYLTPVIMHQDPKVFPDPETFIPERFLPENCVGRSPYAYIPFSAGPRNCIGQKFALLEEKIVIAKLLMNFNLKSVQKREDVKMVPDIILRPADGIHVVISERNPTNV